MAQSAARARSGRAYKYMELTLTATKVAYRGGRAVLVAGEVVPATATSGGHPIGIFAEDKDATSAAKAVTVELEPEIIAEWFLNATSTDAIVAADVGKICYHADDQTVGILGGRVAAGRIWKVDATKGVLVQRLDPSALSGLPLVVAFTSNDFAPAGIENNAVYDVNTTGAASTVTLPAAALDGTRCYFVADGTKNGHTVTYRDATGPVALTTALTASKRHCVVCIKRDSKWYANAYISP